MIAPATAASVLVASLAVKIASLAAGTPLPFHAVLGLMAFFNFAMILPVSLGGFGLQEALVLLLGLPLGYLLRPDRFQRTGSLSAVDLVAGWTDRFPHRA